MKTFLILLLVSVALLLVLGFFFFYRIGEPIDPAKSKSYYRHAWKDKLVHSMMGNWFELSYFEFEADEGTLRILSEDFAVDKNNVYWKGRRQSADAATFEVDKSHFAKDKDHAYLAPDYGDSISVVVGADPKYFTTIARNGKVLWDWHKDNFSYFFKGKKVEVDYPTFELTNETISVDAHSIFTTLTDRSTGIKTFVKQIARPNGEAKAINENFAQIGNTIVLSNWKSGFSAISFTKIDSVHILNERNISVNQKLISDGTLLEGFDVSSFRALDQNYICDNKNVYYELKLVEGADQASFETPYEDYAKDKNHVYYKGKSLAGANPSSFVYQYGSHIATDGTHTWKDGVLVK